MRIAMLGSASSWYLSDLQRAAGQSDEVLPTSFESLSARISASGNWTATAESALNELDAVVVRSMPAGSLEQVVFRMNALARLESAGVPVVNSPRSLEIAIDKYLALTRLQSAGFDVPETICCQEPHAAMDGFETLGRDVVVKPLFGSEGRGMMRLSDPDLARRVFGTLTQLSAVIYLQKFVPHHGQDVRLLVVGKDVFGMLRENERDWRTNISRGGAGRPLLVTDVHRELAHRAADAVGAAICALDLLPGKDGRTYALEVNAVPGWRALSRVNQVDIGSRVVEYLRSVATVR